tara:strand:+ start:540 stop:1067 length:528 start_codon:yes stop_codon:yes gene_type:complete
MSELRTNRIVPRDGLPSGSSGGIIQVKSVSKTDTFSSNSTSYTDVTGLSVSITPTRADSKILVMMHVQIGHDSNVAGFLRLMRDSTAIAVGTDVSSRIASTVAMADDPTDDEINSTSITFLDSPSTTSSTTYKVQMNTEASGNTGYVHVNRSGEDADNNQNGRTCSTITVMEVSG